LEKIKGKIATDRDDLRAVLAECEEIIWASESAVESIDSAIDELSQYV